ncbi:MAG: hypothetical protein Q4E22_00610 [Coriobacteriia bacterium]|nr:hypothetical protein [Coriobacteriia bacterium]
MAADSQNKDNLTNDDVRIVEIKAPGSDKVITKEVREEKPEVTCPNCGSNDVTFTHSPISYTILTCTCNDCSERFTWDTLDKKALDTEKDRISSKPYKGPYPPFL